ncbi:MAG: hypothetical protein QXG98_01865 [Candidatus Micrarchaeia archaeon]
MPKKTTSPVVKPGQYAWFAPRPSPKDFLSSVRASLPKENLDNVRRIFPQIL